MSPRTIKSDSRVAGSARRIVRAVLAAAAAATAASCALGPAYRAPDVAALAPARYPYANSATADTVPADRWWVELDDPVLNALVERALRDNPDLAAAEARVHQARALARAAGAAGLPGANATGRVSRDKLSRNGENLALIPFEPPRTEFTDYRIGIDAAWEIDLAGRTRREVEAAIARFGSQSETRNDARVVVAAEVASAYVDYRVAVERLVLAERDLAALGESVRLVTLSRKAGVASEAELQQAEAERSAAAGTTSAFEAARDGARFRLAALTARAEAELVAELERPAAIPAIPSLAQVGLPSTLLARRPDVRRAERELAAATGDAGSARAAQFPRLALVGDAGFDSIRSGDLTQAASRYWNLAPQLSVPLFAGGRLRRQAEAAEAAREASVATYRSAVLRAFADVETAIVRLAADRVRASGARAAAASLEAAARLSRARFAAGDVSKLEVLAAERAATRAADQRATSAGVLVLDFVALEKVLGGGWQSPN